MHNLNLCLLLLLLHHHFHSSLPFEAITLTTLPPTTELTEFTPTYDWQHVDTTKESLPKGLDIRASLQDDTSLSTPPKGVYARIPPQWSFQTYIQKRTTKPKLRSGFARVPVTKSTSLWIVALHVANRAHSEPEQITFVLNQSVCQRTNVLGYDRTAARTELQRLQLILNNRSSWIYTEIHTVQLFQVKHCLTVHFNDSKLHHADDGWTYIQDAVECNEMSRCNHRQVRLKHCQSSYVDKHSTSGYLSNFLDYCQWPWMLLDACHRKCNDVDEINRYGVPPQHGNVNESENLVDNRFQVGRSHDAGSSSSQPWAYDHKEWNYSSPTTQVQMKEYRFTIPHTTRTFYCTHCYMTNGAIQLLSSFDTNHYDQLFAYDPKYLSNPLAWPRHVSYFAMPANVLLHLHPDTIQKGHTHINITRHSKQTQRALVAATNATESAMGEQKNVPLLPGNPNERTYTPGTVEDPYAIEPYACNRRFVHPVVHAFVWNVMNLFHIVWDLLIPLLEVLKANHFQLPLPVHVFVTAGHPWMLSRLDRILDGHYSPGGLSPLNYMLTKITSGIPIHSTAWLVSL